MMFNVETLNIFYEEISAPEGISVEDFYKNLALIFADQRNVIDIKNYRLGRGVWKKLRDEIIPVSRFIQFSNIKADRIRFPLDNNTPDCWLMTDDGNELGVEVTIERGRERYHLATEINSKGIGRGFIGIQDDALKTTFVNRMANPRAMFSPEHALEATKAGIIKCLSKKNNNKYGNIYYLLIQAHLITLPNKRWRTIIKELSLLAKDLPFKEIYVIGDANEKLCGFQIK